MMLSYQFSLTLILCAFSSQIYAQLNATTTPYLNLTAISAVNGSSVLECWQFPGFTTSASAGTSGALGLFLGETVNTTYTIIPPRFNGGVHNAPAAQFVVFLSGLAHITLPNTTASPVTEAWIQGGKYGVLIAVDTADVSKSGHITEYPSDADTVSLQIPIKDGKVNEHQVLYGGPCGWGEMVGF